MVGVSGRAGPNEEKKVLTREKKGQKVSHGPAAAHWVSEAHVRKWAGLKKKGGRRKKKEDRAQKLSIPPGRAAGEKSLRREKRGGGRGKDKQLKNVHQGGKQGVPPGSSLCAEPRQKEYRRKETAKEQL